MNTNSGIGDNDAQMQDRNADASAASRTFPTGVIIPPAKVEPRMTSVPDTQTSRIPKYVLRFTCTGHTKSVSSVKFSNSGHLLASTSADITVKLWNPENGQKKMDMKVTHSQGISDVAWSHDDRLLCTASDDTTLRLIDVETEREIQTLSGHNNYVFSATFSPDGDTIASSSFDETVRLWDYRANRCMRIFPAHSDSVTAVSFSLDGTLLASCGYDSLCRLWDTESGRCIKTLAGPTSSPASFVRFTPNSKYLLVSSLDSKIRLWDFMSETSVVKTYQGHQNQRFCIFNTFIVTGPTKYVASGSEDNLIYIWDLVTRKVVQTLEGHVDVVLSVAAHPTHPILASGALMKDCSVKIWRDDSWLEESTPLAY
eukprot:CAMPEP_0184692624 /NCGR_PEP_ID=MMETSP0313-20130426/1022_1 /TAXON_ID=2792 /ORGANISM="Porphyridium aerugineum, Strain SAG 1380-2" /LENGTH=369 /DNA_ID=CAMNT_0027150465 /DNA_START=377 /DNA_END=1486 /DNA_ORIENTATION=-